MANNVSENDCMKAVDGSNSTSLTTPAANGSYIIVWMRDSDNTSAASLHMIMKLRLIEEKRTAGLGNT